MPQNYLQSLIQQQVQDFVFANEHIDEKVLMLRQKTILGISTSIIADQLIGRRKSRYKLPSFYSSRNIIYPPSIYLEQSSSERTAQFKAEIISGALNKQKPLGADLTGGFGVDSLFLSRIFNHLDYIETNESLLTLATHNHRVLGAGNIDHHLTSAESFLLSTPNYYDFIFIDPSRRTKTNKVVKLAECEPDLIKLLPLIFEKTDALLVKVSPLLDIQQGVRELPNVDTVFVVAIDNECKELLFLCRKNEKDEPKINCINLASTTNKIREEFSFKFTDERAITSHFSDPLTYLYEPNVSILKAGAFKIVAQLFNLEKIQMNTHLYTSDRLIVNFPGRIFEIKAINSKSDLLRAHFPNSQANVITRNYVLSPDELKKKLKLKDGGDNYLIGFTGLKKKFLVSATRIQ